MLRVSTLPDLLFGCRVTGIRYAWQEDPCCKGIQRGLMPCPVNNCPLHTKTTLLPAAPFEASIDENGVCKCAPPKSCDDAPALESKTK